MSYSKFLANLLEDGRTKVGQLTDPSPHELDEADAVLAAFERRYRLEMPGQPPPVCWPAARWGARMFYRASQFALFRDLDEATVRQSLREACPQPSSPAVCYSVDLVFRFLPDLIKLARSAAARDPLVDELLRLARQWPLSSVGTPAVADVEIEAFVGDPSLLILYVDRIIAARDAGRLNDSRVLRQAQAAVGFHKQLAPEFTALTQTVPAESQL